MDQRPIGVFDSGLGGLTAVHSLWRILPEEDLIYFGDTARVPYGSRSREAILKYARQDVRFLRSFDLKAILIACGTVTTTSLAALQAENDLPMVGVVEPTCRRAVLMTQNKRAAIATVKQTGNSPVPLHLRNAPTKLMKDLNYGQDYKYPHDYPGNFVEQPYLPEELKDKKFYQPQQNAQEVKILERLKAWWRKYR